MWLWMGVFASYEYIQDALLRLQVGFDKKKIDMGIVLVTAQRSEKSPLGSTKELVEKEIEMLYPTINLPVTIVLFDLGRPEIHVQEMKVDEERRRAVMEDDEHKDAGSAGQDNIKTGDDKNQSAGKIPDSLETQDKKSDSRDTGSSIIPQKKRSGKKRHQPINDVTHELLSPIGPLQAA